MNTQEIIQQPESGAAVRVQRLVQRFRSAIINASCSLMNLNSKIHYADLSHEIGWRDNLRWWIEGKLTTVFSWAWDGSDEELEAVVNDEVPERYMSDRQRAYAASLNDRTERRDGPPLATNTKTVNGPSRSLQ